MKWSMRNIIGSIMSHSHNIVYALIDTVNRFQGTEVLKRGSGCFHYIIDDSQMTTEPMEKTRIESEQYLN